MSTDLTKAVEVSELLVKLLEREEDPRALKAAQRLHQHLSLRAIGPILAMVDGTPSEKAKKIGVSRQSYYAWMWGLQRPNVKQARRIARLTGVSVEEIRGK